jgi:photosystem II stability/assembly factor-like uncharacterized protein
MGTAGGVYKTTDQGQNWVLVNNNLFSVYNRLRIEVFASSGTNLIGANRWQGLVMSTDGGSTWSIPAGLPSSYYVSETIAVTSSGVFVVVQEYESDVRNIYYSTDNGANWDKGIAITSDYYPDLYSDGTNVYVVHENSSEEYEFIGTTTNGTALSEPAPLLAFPGTSIENVVKTGDYLAVFGENSFYRYDLVNETWSDLGSSWTNGIDFITGGGNGVDRLYCSVLDGNMNIDAYTSTDNGATWTGITPTLPLGKAFFMGLYATGDEFMASFIDDGIHYSSNAGSTIARRNNGTLASDFDDFYISGDNLIASLFISGAYISQDNGLNWSRQNTGLPNEALQHLADYKKVGSTLYANYFNNPDDDPDPHKVFMSTNDGMSWSEVTVPPGRKNIQHMGFHGTRMYAYSSQLTDGTPSDAFYNTTDGGANWNMITMPTDFMPMTIQGYGSTAYLAGYDASTPDNYKLRVYTSTDNGANWNLHMTGIDQGSLDNMEEDDDVHLVVTDDGKVFLELRYINWNYRLYRIDSGVWEQAPANNAGNLDMESMAYNNGALYFSNWNGGVYQSWDDGETFAKLDNGLPDGISVDHFRFKGDMIYASTNRGIWTYDATPTDVDNLTTDRLSLQPNPAYNMVQVNASVYKVMIYDVSGQLVKDLQPMDNQFSVVDLQKGIYIVKLSTNKGNLTTKLIKK